MAVAAKPKKKKPSRKALLAKVHSRAAEISSAVRIKKSNVGPAGGGVFTTVAIKRGECVGFYKGPALCPEALPRRASRGAWTHSARARPGPCSSLDVTHSDSGP